MAVNSKAKLKIVALVRLGRVRDEGTCLKGTAAEFPVLRYANGGCARSYRT